MEGNAQYFSLYKAAKNGDWKAVKKFLDEKPDVKINTKISDFHHTILHLAVRTNESMWLVKELLKSNPSDPLDATDKDGDTALSYAAMVGNTEAATSMVERNKTLLRTRIEDDHTPLHLAAKYGHEKTVNFLYEKAKEDEEGPSVFSGKSGATLLKFLITSNLYEIALDILQHHVTLEDNNDNPRSVLETLDYTHKESVLETLAQKPLAFASRNDPGFLQRLIYQWILVTNVDSTSSQTEENEDPNGDVEKNNIKSSELAKCTKSTNSWVSNGFGKVVQKVRLSFWNTMKKIGPSTNDIHNKNVKHMPALEIVRLICTGMTWNEGNAQQILEKPIFIATRLGIKEFVQEIITAYPDSTDFLDNERRNIFQLAVLYRQEKVFNLIRTGDIHLLTSTHKDKKGDNKKDKKGDNKKDKKGDNNILHLAGELKPSSGISGAALQMQRELQWFQAVKNLVDPSLQEERNSEGKTPREVFTEKHEDLVKEGQEWMKNTAQSYTVVAALITTVVFTAAFTVPGGTNSEGVPNYLDKVSFLIFSIADALALFLSSISVLLFLTILTSRYSEDDFLTSLPRKLIIGLITLFFSMAFTMAAFGAALHIVLVNRLEWDAIPITIPVCVTVFLFVWLQFPLLVGICRSTYGPSIFKSEKKQLTWLTK